ncbi:MAG: hypothetical protein Q4C87_03695 [Actinomycetaceae bacterium]|nr:hypothetical protein [Actinomycetaceae bacterium]
MLIDSAIFPRAVHSAGVNEYYSLELIAEGIEFVGLVSFRLLDDKGRVKAPRMYFPEEEKGNESPFRFLKGEFVVTVDEEPIAETGLVDITWHFSNGWSLQVFDSDPVESWFLKVDGQIVRAS